MIQCSHFPLFMFRLHLPGCVCVFSIRRISRARCRPYPEHHHILAFYAHRSAGGSLHAILQFSNDGRPDAGFVFLLRAYAWLDGPDWAEAQLTFGNSTAAFGGPLRGLLCAHSPLVLAHAWRLQVPGSSRIWVAVKGTLTNLPLL